VRRSVLLVTAALLAAVALAAAGCGESEEEKAQNEVCDARSEIEASVADLESLTVETATADRVRTDVETIQSGISTISDNADEVSEGRRDDIQSAVQTFRAEFNAILSGLSTNLTVPNAQAQLNSATAELRTAFDESLAQIDCS
jgi:flagellar basal body-associated protein FliL